MVGIRSGDQGDIIVKPVNGVLSSLGTTIFEVMSGLAREHQAINLGQGTPEGLEPPDVMAEAARAIVQDSQQYPPMMGIPALRQAVAHHNKAHYGLDLDWQAEVLVTSGATEALADCLFGLIEPGDEVIVIEPSYDSYLPIIRRAGGIPKIVRLEPPEWVLPRESLREAFSERTKLIIVNTPQNPCAKVYTREELGFIAELVKAHDSYALCDEVYEHLVFDSHQHIPLMTLPGMRDRTVRIGSFGKIFSLTSWKVGYVVAAPALMSVIAKTHQFTTFTTPTALQTAMAWGLTNAGAYIQRLPRDLTARRDRLVIGLESIGFKALPAAGTYFLTTDFSAFGFNGDDAAFCRHLVTQAKVATVPVSAFYEARQGLIPPSTYIRFCFAKTDVAIDEAINRLGRFLR